MLNYKLPASASITNEINDPLEESPGQLLGGARRKYAPLPLPVAHSLQDPSCVRGCIEAGHAKPQRRVPPNLGYLVFLVRMLIKAKLQPNKQTNKIPPRWLFAHGVAKEGSLKGSFMTRGDF